ncbi:MAG: PAS domain S-box protein [Dehalococcoidales bacterium]|nr:PAS domain S-box protein [Dehalococcoidales bacterium]
MKVIKENKLHAEESKTNENQYEKANELSLGNGDNNRSLIEVIPDILVNIDINGIIIDINTSVENITGIPPNKLIGTEFSKYFTNTEKAWANFQEVLEKGSGNNYELDIRHSHGAIKTVLCNGVVYRDGDGEVAGIYAAARDITEYKQLQREVHGLEHNFRNTLDNSPLGIRIITEDGELLYANHAILAMYGYDSFEELKNTPIKDRYTRESYVAFLKRREKRRQGEPTPNNYEISINHKDGKIRHLAVFRKEVIWNGKKEYQALYQDITEHKEADIALKESEEFNSSLLINSLNPILVINNDYSIKYVNPALEKLTGYSQKELIGVMPPYPWWIKDNYERTLRRLKALVRRKPRKYEELFQNSSGELFWVEVSQGLVSVDGEIKYQLISWTDLTEQRRLRKNMQFYISAITRAQEEERKRIAREIHDDSIQALAALILEIDSMVQQQDGIPKSTIRKLRRLRSETNNVVEGLRKFSHRLRPDIIDQIGLIPALEVLGEEFESEHGINMSLEIRGFEKRLKTEVELILFRIVQEALRNVRKHSEATKAIVRIQYGNDKIRLTIADNGIGFILPEVLGDFAADGKLGLIGIRERANLLDSKLLVKSRFGKGTAVMIEVRNTYGMVKEMYSSVVIAQSNA